MSTIGATAEFPCGPERVWTALTSRYDLCGWLGQVPHGLVGVGDSVTVVVGGADHYVLSVTAWDPPRRVVFDWSFLGLLPASPVCWELEPTASGGARVTIAEADAGRSAADSAVERALWAARLSQLHAHLDGHADPRRAALTDIRLSTTVPTSTVQLLGPHHVHRWLPVTGVGSLARHFFIVDSSGPRRFPITQWDAHFDDRLVLRIAIEPVSPATTARVTIEATGPWPTLSVEHTGWSTLGLPPERAVELRTCFHDTWRLSLTEARKLRPIRGRA